MNIGVIHGFIGGGGGTEKTLFSILDSLQQTKHNITLYTFSKPKIRHDKIHVKSILPFSFSSFGLYQRTMESKLIKNAKNEDILIQASGGLGIPQRQDQKIIIYCHNDFSNELNNPSTKYKKLWSKYYRPYYNMIKKFVNHIQDKRINLISNSKHTHDSIKQNYKKESQIIYPPVDLTEFSDKDKEKMIVTIGRYSREKNLEFGIDTIKGLDMKYHIVGNTKTKSNMMYYNKLKSQITKDNLKKINLHKNTTRKELIDILNKSKVYFHCSRETFGISVVEAIAAGCIPIVPNNSGHIETVPFSDLRYIENDSTDAQKKVTKALSGFYDDLKQPMKDSIKKYDKNEFARNIINYIENL